MAKLIRLTLIGTADESWDGARSEDGDIVIQGETWTEVVEGLRSLSFMERHSKDGPETVLDRFIERWEKINLADGVHLYLDNTILDLDEKAKALFRAMSFRGQAKVEELDVTLPAERRKL